MRYLFLFFVSFFSSHAVIEITNNVSYNLKTYFISNDSFVNDNMSKLNDVISDNIKMVKGVNLNPVDLPEEYNFRCVIAKKKFITANCQLENFLINENIETEIFEAKNLSRLGHAMSSYIVKNLQNKEINFDINLAFVEYEKKDKFHSYIRISDVLLEEPIRVLEERGLIFRLVFNRSQGRIYYNLLLKKGDILLKYFDIYTKQTYLLSLDKKEDMQGIKPLSPAFSPSGNAMLFSAILPDKTDSPIFLYKDGKFEKLVSKNINSTPAFLDENTIIYSSDAKGTPKIFKKSLDSFFGFSSPLIDQSFDTGMFEPAVQSSGNLISFTTIAYGKFALYLYNLISEDVIFFDSGELIERSDWSKDNYFLAYGFQNTKKENTKIKLIPATFRSFNSRILSLSNPISYPIFLD